jgi:hypothetical protein
VRRAGQARPTLQGYPHKYFNPLTPELNLPAHRCLPRFLLGILIFKGLTADVFISPNWKTLASRRKLSQICALFKAYTGERAWKPIGDRLKRPHYLSSVDHEWKISSRRQRTDIQKYSFVNRTIQLWNQLPAVVLGNLPCKQITFKKRGRKAVIEFN